MFSVRSLRTPLLGTLFLSVLAAPFAWADGTAPLRPLVAAKRLNVSKQASGLDKTVRQLAPGVVWTQEIDHNAPNIINVVTVDLTVPGVHLGVGLGQDKVAGGPDGQGREDVSHYARRHGALAAVNADFFPFTGDPLGVGIRNGELFSEPWTGNGKGGPRVAFGLTQDGSHVLMESLGFLGDLQAQDGQRAFLNGINRSAGGGEIVVYTSMFGDTTQCKRGGTEVVLRDVNLPVRANKLIYGRVDRVTTVGDTPQAIHTDNVIIAAPPGQGADFLSRHIHAGDKIGFALAVTTPDDTEAAIKLAQLPRVEGDLPSRDGLAVSRQAFAWAGVQQACGGGPMLLRGGVIAVNAAAEGFDAGFSDHAHPRTALGTNAAGDHLIIVTVDGRQTLSKGASLTDLAEILKRYGATDGMNLDGGGSTAMAIAGLVVSNPSGTGDERPVADMLTVYSDHPTVGISSDFDPATGTVAVSDIKPAGKTPHFALQLPNGTIVAGVTVPISITENGKLRPSAALDALWQGPATGGVGFVTQRGAFVALTPGIGSITALYQGHLLTVPVTVTGSAAPLSLAIRADFSADATGITNRSQLTVRILDTTNMPRANAPVHLQVMGGTPDLTDLQTTPDGYATVGITWDADSGGSVLVSSGTLTPVTLKRP